MQTDKKTCHTAYNAPLDYQASKFKQLFGYFVFVADYCLRYSDPGH